MTALHTTLYVIAVVLALAFVLQVLPESPLGFGVFSLILAVFLHPLVKWKSWLLVVIGAGVGSGLVYIRQRTPWPFSIDVILFVAIGVAACAQFYYRRLRNRPS